MVRGNAALVPVLFFALIFAPLRLAFSQAAPSSTGETPRASAGTTSAQPAPDYRVTMPVPSGLQPAVDFWLLIFTKYGKNQQVFHHREYPGIVYSVVDFSELMQRFGGREFERQRDQAVLEETVRIQATLRSMATGRKPQSPFERRLERLFTSVKAGSITRLYSEAALTENIRTQTGIREKFADGVARSRRYSHAMERIFREAGLPPELSRLPHVESSFDYTAYSSVGAAGIWQFMRGTGKRYMKIDSIVDERRDPIISTRAAAHYLRHSYNIAQSWPLAVTSYNHGLAGIMRAAKEVGSKDLPTIIRRYNGSSFGFASKNFYAEFLAAVEADRNWRVYFPSLRLERPIYFDEVKLGSSIGFAQLARTAGLSTDELEMLNPGLLRPILQGRFPIPAGKIVKVPSGKGQVLARTLRGATLYSLTELPTPSRDTAPPKRKSSVKSSKNVSKKSTSSTSAKKSSSKKASTKSGAKPKPQKSSSGSTKRFPVR
ncbi:MAG: lytic transglycosylase domain-containing protein [Deltaproteobacteria bacterium]|nr:lytic transglycosylase domain-containing protein [Deltaproteobacteria bacterium]